MGVKKFKRSFFGYSPAEVDEFWADLQQQRKMLMKQNNSKLLSEIAELEKLLEQYNKDELKMLEEVTLKLTDNDGVVYEARKKSQKMKQEALDNLEIQQAKLAERQSFLQEVLGNLAHIKGNLTDVNRYLKPLTIVTKGVEKGEKTV